jgi:glutamate-5-semialdehyde dehydrogenase
VLGLAPTEQKNRALRAAAAALRAKAPQILAANDEDMREGSRRELSGALLDRLRLDDSRIDAMARGLDEIERLADPIGRRWRSGRGRTACRSSAYACRWV